MIYVLNLYVLLMIVSAGNRNCQDYKSQVMFWSVLDPACIYTVICTCIVLHIHIHVDVYMYIEVEGINHNKMIYPQTLNLEYMQAYRACTYMECGQGVPGHCYMYV